MVEPCLRSLAHKGRLTEISSAVKERQVCFDLIDFYRRELSLLGINSLALDACACAEILRTLTPGFESSALHPPIAGINRYPLKDAITAYEQVLSRSVTSKAILAPKIYIGEDQTMESIKAVS
jgi:NADPH:quinone reductase-like Zn-dependent oxidoreductase